MFKIFFRIILFLVVGFFIQCESSPLYHAEIIQEGCFECFAENTTYDNGKLVSCELSGVTYYKNQLMFIDDKPIPGTSSIFSLCYQIPFGKPTFLGNEIVKNARKYEDISLTPHQKYIFAITSFDRYKEQDATTDAYNVLIYGESSQSDSQKIAYPTYKTTGISSLRLRPIFRHALRSLKYKDGPPYFKIEGLATLPGNIILFGIREIGTGYTDFDYTVTIIGAHYGIKNNIFYFEDSPRIVFQFNPKDIDSSLNHPLGLSSLEYDTFNKRLYILTSYEHGETDIDVGAYLWIVPLKKFLLKEQKMRYSQRPRKYKLNIGKQLRGQYKLEIESKPILVRTKENFPLHFAHKAEGIAVLEDNSIFIVHDDDRILGREFISDKNNQFSRKLNQAAYSIVQFE
jgi:hypothetical protein